MHYVTCNDDVSSDWRASLVAPNGPKKLTIPLIGRPRLCERDKSNRYFCWTGRLRRRGIEYGWPRRDITLQQSWRWPCTLNCTRYRVTVHVRTRQFVCRRHTEGRVGWLRGVVLSYKPPRAVLFISINQNAVYMLAYADDIHYNIFVLFCAGYFSCLPICLSLSSTVCYPLYVWNKINVCMYLCVLDPLRRRIWPPPNFMRHPKEIRLGHRRRQRCVVAAAAEYKFVRRV